MDVRTRRIAILLGIVTAVCGGLLTFRSTFFAPKRGVTRRSPEGGLETRPSRPAGPVARASLVDGYGKLPLSFEPNQGQTDDRVKFLSRGRGYTLFLTGDEAVLSPGRRVQSDGVS